MIFDQFNHEIAPGETQAVQDLLPSDAVLRTFPHGGDAHRLRGEVAEVNRDKPSCKKDISLSPAMAGAGHTGLLSPLIPIQRYFAFTVHYIFTLGVAIHQISFSRKTCTLMEWR